MVHGVIPCLAWSTHIRITSCLPPVVRVVRLGDEVHRLGHGRDLLAHAGRRAVDALLAPQQLHRHAVRLVQPPQLVGRHVVRRALHVGGGVVRHRHHQHARPGRHALRQQRGVPRAQPRLDGHQGAAVPHRIHGGTSPRREPERLLAEADAELSANPRIRRRVLVFRDAEPAAVRRAGVRRAPQAEQVALDDGHVAGGVHAPHPCSHPRGLVLRGVAVRAGRGAGHAALGEELLGREAGQLDPVHAVAARRQPRHVHRLAAQGHEHAPGVLGRRGHALAQQRRLVPHQLVVGLGQVEPDLAHLPLVLPHAHGGFVRGGVGVAQRGEAAGGGGEGGFGGRRRRRTVVVRRRRR
mmetsp:Transcript_4571/g.11547  ORF Transcript_4571/g.11547 Transcript_4571/m.11547 type:complete len:352 (+) Transcript_4571:461-1516(+)